MHFAASDVNDGKRPFTAVAKTLEDCPELAIQPRAPSDALFDLVAPGPGWRKRVLGLAAVGLDCFGHARAGFARADDNELTLGTRRRFSIAQRRDGATASG